MTVRLLHRAFRANETAVHELNYLFWECTTRCNLHCRHCGSDCFAAGREVDMPLADFLRAFAEQGEDLDQYIISALNEMNPLLSPRDKGSLADGRYMTGYTREETERIRKQILNATKEDLIRCTDWLEAFSRDGAVCVVAHQDALDECSGLTVSDL